MQELIPSIPPRYARAQIEFVDLKLILGNVINNNYI